MPQLYNMHRLEKWVNAYLLARSLGVTVTELLGLPTCSDQCGLERCRWVRIDCTEGSYYRCRDCQRFIGWIKPKATAKAAQLSNRSRGISYSLRLNSRRA